MKRGLIIPALGVMAFCTALWAYSVYPELGCTSSPEDYATSVGDCTDCHGTYALNARGAVLIRPDSPTYSPSQVITIRVTDTILNTPAIDKWGFECRTERTSDGASVGTFVGDGGTETDTATNPDNGSLDIFQADNFRPQADSAWWTFTWTAPASNMGDIAIYCNGVLSNSGQGTNNDYVVSSAETLTYSVDAEEKGPAPSFSLQSGGLFTGTLPLFFSLPQAGDVRLTLYDASGKLTEVLYEGYAKAGSQAALFPVSGTGAGAYFARLEQGGRALTTPVVKIE